MKRRKIAALATPVLALGLVLSACGGGGSGKNLEDAGSSGVKVSDINAQSLDKIKDGGNFTSPLDQMPDNWNVNELDGTNSDTQTMAGALMPWLFTQNADATVAVNKNYLDSAEVVGTNPQVVEYKINPKAKWSNGRALSWEDFDAQWKAMRGKDNRFLPSNTVGYTQIAKVARGANDQDVKITFNTNFAEWKNNFSPFYPKEINADPTKFNKAYIDKPTITAGPFQVKNIDKVGKQVVLERDPSWWGDTPKLDTMTFKVVDRKALPDALANGQIDWYNINNDINTFRRAQADGNTVVRQSAFPDYTHLTFNGAKSSILAEKDLRVAIGRGIDTVAIAKSVLGQMQKDTKPLGNHLYLKGTKNYQDHSGGYTNDATTAKADLDKLGWKQNGEFRAKNGKQLKIRLVIPADTPISLQTGKILQVQLKGIGVNLDIQSVPTAEFFQNYVNVGNFDVTLFRWFNTAYPIGGGEGIYYLDPKNVGQNYGRVGTPELNAAFDKASKELDDGTRAQLLNDADKQIWAAGHHIPIFQSPGAFAVRKTLANFGSPGYANQPYDFVKVGFLK